MTLPNEAYSIQELLIKYSQGILPAVGRDVFDSPEQGDFDSPDLGKVGAVDMTERAEAVEFNAARLRDLDALRQKQEDALRKKQEQERDRGKPEVSPPVISSPTPPTGENKK